MGLNITDGNNQAREHILMCPPWSGTWLCAQGTTSAMGSAMEVHTLSG